MDRFGDDLCEVIVDYLPIGDKLRYECISKQFKRLLFNRHRVLVLSETSLTGFDDNVDTISQVLTTSREYKRLFNIEIHLFRQLVAKLPWIQVLVIDNYCIIDGNVLRAIGDNCRHLRRFVCTSIKCMDISDEDLRYFGQQVSATLRSLQFDCLQDFQLNLILRLTRNSIRSVNIQNNNFIVSNDFVFLDFHPASDSRDGNHISQLCPKLDTIYITCYSVEDLKRFADYYSQNIRKIEIKFVSNYMLGDVMNAGLKQLSRFVNLQSLTLLIYNYQKGFIAPIDEGLRMIGTNCPKLEHFVCEMTKNLISGQLFQVLSPFCALKTCKISTTYEIYDTRDPYGTVAQLAHCKHLKHITLYLKYLSDKHLSHIHLSLPHLQTFKVNTSNGFIGDKTLESLAQLPRLTTVEISGTSPALINITDEGVCPLVIKCPLLRQLCLFCKTSVGKQSVDQFISIARKYPKNIYKYFYECNHDLCSEIPINYELTGHPVPQNLQIFQI
ncbi:unnamed protein product [Oppiella nova]|uniref:Uncharacterized protein n=1 Tax=Oppiella nova TaxID=334625 RepID=A0A7R9MI34_9ACAR|nr:unnamed protein product [Oppiella nova]CAG2177773.1 unnamed protein product [Oppiella nova]